MVISRANSIRKAAKTFEESLAGRYPELLAEWDYQKNPFRPDEPVPGSTVMAHWICLEGHEYQKQIGKRALKNSGCPYCRDSSPILLSGFNDLKTKFPELSKEWHPTRNKKTASEIRAFDSTGLNWWICKNSHEWKSSVFNRTRNGSGCPECSNKTSKGELELLSFIRELGYQAKYTDRTVIAPYELDIWIPKLKVAFEFNGVYWHSNKMIQERANTSAHDYHLMKKELAEKAGVRLAFVWQDDWVLSPAQTKDSIERFLKGNHEEILSVYEKPYSLELLKRIQRAR